MGGTWTGGRQVGGKLMQVFSRRSGDWRITDARNKLLPNTDLVLFVDLDTTPPEFFPVPADAFHDYMRPQHVAHWRNRWDVLAG
ncbi:MAG TPA: hypothetical protein VGJ45_38375 [Pseudonocardiaceae bacterium]